MFIVELVTNGWRERYGVFETRSAAFAARDKLVEYRQKNLTPPLRGHRTYSEIIELRDLPSGL